MVFGWLRRRKNRKMAEDLGRRLDRASPVKSPPSSRAGTRDDSGTPVTAPFTPHLVSGDYYSSSDCGSSSTSSDSSSDSGGSCGGGSD